MVSAARLTPLDLRVLDRSGFSQVIVATTKSSYLGSGSSADVFRIQAKSSSIPLVAKRMKDEVDETFIDNEYHLLRRLDHPNIVKCKGRIESASSRMLIMEYAGSIELFDLIIKSEYRDKRKAHRKSIVKQLADALKYLHDLNLVYSDLTFINKNSPSRMSCA